jgi:Uncharacterized protein conserved in bacteria
MIKFQFDKNEAEFDCISKMYNEPNRAYHNLNHVNDCLNKLDSLEAIENKIEIEMAFWFHDVIYDPYRKDNELKSAEKAKAFLIKQETDDFAISFVYDLIMATIHKEAPKNESEAYIMDIDISILGSDPTSYQSYCDNIRKEYKMVPGFIYKKNRIKIMEMFLNRKQLYYTSPFKDKYEEQARTNIKNELANLRKGR